MEALQPAPVDGVWPEHAEDLTSIMFAQSVLKRFENELTVTTATPAPEEINPHYSSHPLNDTHQELSEEECARLWNDLLSGKQGTVVLNDLKTEALRQVRIYIRKGIDALRKQQSSQSLKRQRSEPVETEEGEEPSTKRRKVVTEEAEKDDATTTTEVTTAPEPHPEPEQATATPQGQLPGQGKQEDVPASSPPASESVADVSEEGSQKDREDASNTAAASDPASVADASAPTSDPTPETKELSEPPSNEEPAAQPTTEEVPSKDDKPDASKAAESDFNESDSSGNHDSDVPDSEAADGMALHDEDHDAEQTEKDSAADNDANKEDNKELPLESEKDEDAPRDDTQAASRDASEESDASRQPSAAPEDTETPRETEHELADTKPDTQHLQLPEAEQNENDMAETPRSRRRSRASRASRSARSTPQASRAASAEPSSSQNAQSSPVEPAQPEEKEVKEPTRTQKRKASTPVASDREPSPSTDGSLLSLVTALRASTVLEPFQKPFSENYPIVLSPTDLSTIYSQVEKGEIRDLEEVEQELAKMLANAVMGPRLDVKEAAAAISSEIATFSNTASSVPSSRTAPTPSQTQNTYKRKR